MLTRSFLFLANNATYQISYDFNKVRVKNLIHEIKSERKIISLDNCVSVHLIIIRSIMILIKLVIMIRLKRTEAINGGVCWAA